MASILSNLIGELKQQDFKHLKKKSNKIGSIQYNRINYDKVIILSRMNDFSI